VDATPEALKPGIATAVPGLFLIMESDGWAIHMVWAVGLDGFARADLSPDGDRRGRFRGPVCCKRQSLAVDEGEGARIKGEPEPVACWRQIPAGL